METHQRRVGHQVVNVSLTREHDLLRLEVSASDVRMAFEAAVRAMLGVTDADANRQLVASRAVPFRGEGADLAALFQDLVADLEAQLDTYGHDADEVTVDGILKNRDGGYVGWGYVHGSFLGETREALPRLLDPPTVNEDPVRGVVLQARLAGS